MLSRMLGSFIGFLGGAYVGFRWARDVNRRQPLPKTSAMESEDDSYAKPATLGSVTSESEGPPRDNTNFTATIHALATTTLAVILSFALRRDPVDKVLVVFSVLSVVAIIFVTGFWPRPSGRQPPAIRSRARIGSWLSAGSWLSLMLLTIFIAMNQGLRPIFDDPVFDGRPPGAFDCESSQSDVSSTSLENEEGLEIAVVDLVRSDSCATVWARVRYPRPGLVEDKIAVIRMFRPVDGKVSVAESVIGPRIMSGDRVGGMPYSVGDMLYNDQACVLAEVTLVDAETYTPGSDYMSAGSTAETRTPCIKR